MTSWPWMKGVQVAVADPIPPVNEHDKRPSVKELIEKHRSVIDQVKQELGQDPLYDDTKHDDLWILRFVLSHKKKKKAVIKAAKHTLQFRREHKLDEEDMRPYPPVGGPDHPRKAANIRYAACNGDDFCLFCVPDPQLGVITVLELGSIDQYKLVETLPEEDWLPSFLYLSEWCFQWLDYISRTTGRLTKNTRLAHAGALRFSSISSENQRRDGKVMAIMEDIYPQLLQGIFVCNAPVWIQIPWRLVRPFFPKRVVEKLDFIAPHKNKHELKRLLPHISIENLPTRFGGKNETWPVDFPVPPTTTSSS